MAELRPLGAARVRVRVAAVASATERHHVQQAAAAPSGGAAATAARAAARGTGARRQHRLIVPVHATAAAAALAIALLLAPLAVVLVEVPHVPRVAVTRVPYEYARGFTVCASCTQTQRIAANRNKRERGSENKNHGASAKAPSARTL